MKRRTLGKSGLTVSEIGLGCWQLGGDFGPIDEERAMATMQAASRAGISFFDTADVYGGGRSETLVGRHIADGAERPVVATKVGRSSDLFPHSSYEFDVVRSHLLGSLERLGVGSLDLIQLHCVPFEILKRGAVFDIMNRLQAEGLCKHWGASVETIEEAKLCLAQEQLVSLQIIFNLFRQDAAWELFPEAQAANVGIIVRLPLASGLLTGKFRADHIFGATDHRNFNRDGQFFSVGETLSGLTLATGADLAAELSEYAPEGWSLADLSLRWILDFPAVSTVIAGCSRPEQVAQNARASDLPPLSPELHGRLKAFYLSRVRSHIRCPI
jgi:aryl-alcohol dehydrogenase-like predicted oxidoreductase